MWALGTLSSNPFTCFFLWPLSFLIRQSILNWKLERDLMQCSRNHTPISDWDPSFLVLCPLNSRCPGFPSLPAPSSQLSSLPGFPPRALRPRSSPYAVSWGNCKLICFLSLRDHSALLTDVQCLKNTCFMCFVQSYFRLKNKSSSCYSVLARTEMLPLILLPLLPTLTHSLPNSYLFFQKKKKIF